MSRRRHRLRIISPLAAVAAVVTLWVLFAPTALGGPFNYAVVDGSSMEPHIHAGDLAVLEASDRYRVGDVVGYHNAQLGRIVLHRIVGRIGDQYVFKGDNNRFFDSYRPTRSALIGRLSLRIPVVGTVFDWLRRPGHAALVAGLVALLVLSGGVVEAGRRRRRGGGDAQQLRSRSPRISGSLHHEGARTLLGIGLLAALACGLLTVVGYQHGTSRTIETPGAFTQQGSFRYAASARPGTVYPTGSVATGQTVFTRLVHRMRIDFRYRFTSPLPHDVRGSASLTAVLTSSVGWRRTIATEPRKRFRGDRTTLSLPVDLTTLEGQLAGYLRDTGLASDTFTVVVTPRINLHGHVGVETITEAFAPTGLSFLLDPYSLRPAQPTLGSQAPGQPAPDPLHPSAVGVLHRTVPRTITLLGAHPRVASVRRLGLLGLLAAAVAAVIGAGLLLGGEHNDELSKIERQHRDALVQVTSPPAQPATGFVDVACFDSLAQLADGYDRPILHDQHADQNTFYVEDDGSVYRYRLQTHAETVAPARPPANASLRG